MPDLIAQGEEAQQRWRRTLPGRAAGGAGPRGRRVGGALGPARLAAARRGGLAGRAAEGQALPQGRNPVYFRGQEAAEFSLQPGEHFVIGQTTFTLADQRVNVAADAPQPVQQQSFSSQYLKQVQFRNPDHRIEVLSRLPEVIWGDRGPSELFVRLVSMLLAGVPRADAAAVVAAEPEPSASPPARSRVHVLHWDQRLVIGGDFQPSQRLIFEALRQRQSVLHVWRGKRAVAGPAFHRARQLRLGLLHAGARQGLRRAGGSTWPGGSTSSGPGCPAPPTPTISART